MIERATPRIHNPQHVSSAALTRLCSEGSAWRFYTVEELDHVEPVTERDDIWCQMCDNWHRAASRETHMGSTYRTRRPPLVVVPPPVISAEEEV